LFWVILHYERVSRGYFTSEPVADETSAEGARHEVKPFVGNVKGIPKDKEANHLRDASLHQRVFLALPVEKRINVRCKDQLSKGVACYYYTCACTAESLVHSLVWKDDCHCPISDIPDETNGYDRTHDYAYMFIGVFSLSFNFLLH